MQGRARLLKPTIVLDPKTRSLQQSQAETSEPLQKSLNSSVLVKPFSVSAFRVEIRWAGCTISFF
jgi:hypothetical protein